MIKRLVLAVSFFLGTVSASFAAGDLQLSGEEEGGIGGTGMVQSQVPEEVFEPPELIDSIEDTIPEVPDGVGIGGDIPDSPDVNTPE